MAIRITLPRRKARFTADRRGAAAMEFALLLPILTLMLTAVWPYGALYFSYNMMTVAARDGARALANETATEAEVIANTKANLPGWLPAGDVTVVARSAATTGTSRVDVRVTAPAAKATIVNLGPMPENIEAFVTMESES
jgi:Flp pilus assembly protein TadG